MDIERSSFETSRILNLIEGQGWNEEKQSVDGDNLSVSVRKSLEGMEPAERRMCLNDLATIVRVFGWEFEASGIEEKSAFATITKVLVSESAGDVEVDVP